MNFKINESTTKLRGGYYTDPDIATFLLRWVLEIQPKTLLEPSCGDGVFLSALSKLDHASVQRILAFEIDDSEASKAETVAELLKNTRVEIKNSDFLEWSLVNIMQQEQVDAVVGNPPFIRYQYLDTEIQDRSQEIFRLFHLPFTKHTNAWVPFIIASIAFLRPGGRLAMVIPAEIFHVLHAQSLRTFLTEKCSQILLFDPEEIWFENTLQGAVILLAEKKETPSQKFRGVGIIPTKTRSFLNNEASGYFANADFTNGETVSGKWMLALLSKHERSILSKARKNQFIHPFTDLASVAVGIVTGANKFFLVADETVEKYDLGAWAHPMFGRSEHVPGVVYNEQVHTLNKDRGVPTNFLWFEDTPVAELSKDAQEYIHFGESQLLHTRYKCRIRQPWYSVPSVYSTSIGMLKRSHHFPRLILNEIEAYTTDTAYRIQPKGIKNEQLVSCFVNSLTALSAELEGRHYGGGVLELVPSEIRKILIPNVVTAKESVYHLDHLFRQGMAHEEILTIQDATILKAAGFSEEERFSILAAWLRLNRRRQRISD